MKLESANWVVESLIPKMKKAVSRDRTYLKRINAIYALEIIANNTSGSGKSKIAQMVISESRDPIPNIRMIAVKSMRGMFKGLESSDQSQIKR